MADMNTTQMPDLVLETTLPVGFIETSTFGDELAAIAETIAARSGYCSDRDELFERIQSIDTGCYLPVVRDGSQPKSPNGGQENDRDA